MTSEAVSPPSAAPNSKPRLKRLAARPLKLAASTFRPLSSSRSGATAPVAVISSSTTLVGSTQQSDGNAGALTPQQVASAARGPRKPLEGEEPAAWLRVRVVKAEGLVAKDRGGTSDPFVSLVLPPSGRHSTPVVKKSLSPTFVPESSTFDFPLYLSLAGVIGGRGLEAIIWDKDLMRKEYLGEISIPLQEWFEDLQVRLWNDNPAPRTWSLLSTRRKRTVSGTITLQIGFVPPKEALSREEALKKIKMIFSTIVERASAGRGLAGVLGVPAYEGIGTIKMRSSRPPLPETAFTPSPTVAAGHSPMALLQSATASIVAPLAGKNRSEPNAQSASAVADIDDDHSDDDDMLFPDDGLSTSSTSDEFEDALEEEDETQINDSQPLMKQGITERMVEALYHQSAGLPPPRSADLKRVESDGGTPKTASLVPPETKPMKTPTRQSSLPGYFDRPAKTDESPGPSTPGMTPGMVTPGGTKLRKPLFKRTKSNAPSRKSTKDFNFDASQGKQVLGIVVMEIKSASDLPKIKNSLRLSFDMDPFVVISFGQKVFRTRVIRHSLNPTWDEKLFFHVRRHESTFTVKFAVLDWDKISGNDMVGTATLPLNELMGDCPKPNPKTGLYGKNEDGKHEMKEFTLSLSTERDMPWESKHSPKLTIRAKYEPYDALRQRFWRQYIAQYDADETGTISYTELTAMLDSLGSTLTRSTIEGYFISCGKSADKDELTIDELIQSLEYEVTKSRAEKAPVNKDDPSPSIGSGMQTPSVAPKPVLDGLSMTGPSAAISSPVDADELAEHIRRSTLDSEPGDGTGGNMRPVNKTPGSDLSIPVLKVERVSSMDGESRSVSASGAATPAMSDTEDADSLDERERIINIRTCPLCHRSRLKRKSEQDIVTHLAICASTDWTRVDRIITASYVTSSQAQRKFMTRIVNKVAVGAYSLGANSANILVQDRLTGQLQEEKMAVYVRLGIRVLYKGAKSRMEGTRARKLLKSLSVKQGIKYDSPSSVVDILPFIAFHRLNTDEILEPISSFKSFNQFFYRKLKPGARPVDEPGNEARLVSCADCRMMAFETVDEATSIWIKGREFTVGRLLGPNYKDVIERYNGGALAIFRLAPQDYHRFHSPVAGTIGKMTMIDGEYYTVNPQAIRTTLDVYGENVRKIVPIQSEEFGLVMTVWVGAMMVGSILTSVKEGQHVNRADELGYFAFGGSTIVCLFERGVMEWDEDLLANGRAAVETLVRMGMGIGRSTRSAQKTGTPRVS
ncbi:hypothetical protein TREMEDRAFT_67577 [Tremella mesenterica DSM 1558]|uniref:uncharacterized protein n=1 Tax=Tremella mesenterica (strain ATCC 24925 / CBS 8224 / DSM 1558 / NBRC 9311 / NRRL Y-6157 / RJB 2259-6 / UBC 559-6) TaxID=578456 RepID=UPI0003F49B94|nr:uncharacterized protein TREMEDRAFT_67577 [Tremella mesenterica DSM 1558]EIW71117.1 hypothetical protein TREMEDRAFT_67577 [Tremella mesenterica DSM 1558]